MIRIGTDIIEIERVAKNLGSDAFLKHVYAPKELAPPWRAESMAARFCAKEALIKVFGERVPFYEIAILNDEKGRPYYELTGKAKALQTALGITDIDLSLAHCKEYAVAFACGQCVAERKG